MWRRYADEVYAIVVLVVFTAEAVALGLLTSFFVLRLVGVAPGLRAEGVVVAGVGITALAVMGLAVYVVGYHGASEARDRRRVQRAGEWTERWVRVVFSAEQPPRAPIPTEAADALLDLYEATRGAEAERIGALMRRYHLGRRFSRPLERAPSRRLAFALRPRSTARRLEALEALAKARVPSTLGVLLGLFDDADPAVRRMALRAAARTLARVAPSSRERAAAAFVKALRTADVPAGSVEDALLLLEGAAAPVLHRLLKPSFSAVAAWASDRRGTRRPDDAPSATPVLLVARALDAVGRLKLHGMVPAVVAHLRDPDPETRAASLRALADLRALPDEARDAVTAGLSDETEFVRLQAARCATLLPANAARPRLRDLMGDQSWWVRRAAARALLALDHRGTHLRWVARTHPDPYAREMAAQVLLDAGRIDERAARTIKEPR